MRLRHSVQAAALAAATLAGAAFAGGETSGPATGLSWRDLESRSHTARVERGATVLVFGSTECPCADGYTARVLRLSRDYAKRPVRFFMAFSGASETEKGVRDYAAKRKLTFPVILDRNADLASRLGAQATPTGVVLDAEGVVRYAGRIDDSTDERLVRDPYLREALDAVLHGKRVAKARTVAVGCAIGGSEKPAATKGVRLLPGLGKTTFPVTANRAARPYFQQGLALWYGFNFDEAERAFREAARLDPQCAMAPWGTALSLGMNYNWDFDPTREAEVFKLTRQALALAGKVSKRERRLIQALALRHADAPQPDGKLFMAYADAMRKLTEERPDDVDVAVLYAASAMDLRPWNLWSADGAPREGTLAIVAALERALETDPDHIGAHHLLIHAVEAGPEPERALKSAQRLAVLAPKSGHLVHMPAHIFQRVGDYKNAAKSNRDGADVDAAYAKQTDLAGRYVAYYVHNLDFLAYSHNMAGRSADALATARELNEVIARYRPKMRGAMCPSGSLVVSDVLVRFERWDDILKAPEPAADDLSGKLFDLYARGVALTAKGDLPGAERMLRAMETAGEGVGPALATGAAGTPYEKAGPVLVQTARCSLSGKIALARGDMETAIRLFREGAAAEDRLPYAEPAMWRTPVRESLGAALLKAGRAAEAEAVFRDDLKRNRGNGRSLFGLWKSLAAQNKPEAKQAEADYRAAWKHADVAL